MPSSTMNNPEDRIPFTSRIHISWQAVLSILFLGVIIYFLIFVQKTNASALLLERQNVIGNFKLLFTYYLPFECISIGIIIYLLGTYHKLLNIKSVVFAVQGIVAYELIMLPVVLISIIIFAPVTNLFRYVILYYSTLGWKEYYPVYFFTPSMYFNYLVPTLVVSYLIININLFYNYRKWQVLRLNSLNNQISDLLENKQVNSIEIPDHTSTLNSIDAYDVDGRTELAFKKILFFEVENKRYLAYTNGETYTIRHTLAELNETLPKAYFYRISRSVVINLSYFKSYSYWENDKYIIRLTDEKTTFVMQRARLDEFKNRLKNYHITTNQLDNFPEL